MSLLDDVRRDLSETITADDYTGASWPACRICGGYDGRHENDCVVPRIIVTLQAAERLARRYGTVYIEELALDIEALGIALESPP